MTWQRIEESTYIDDTLVTCAEYQLFINEMREQGKHYQPDHWISQEFSEGQARNPILGVRHSDAVAFCGWLTKRNTEKWRYRLPVQKEVDDLSIDFYPQKPLGYWTDKEYEFAWIGDIPNNARAIDFKIITLTDFDIVTSRSRSRVVDLNYACGFEPELYQVMALTIDLKAFVGKTDVYASKSLERTRFLGNTFNQNIQQILVREITQDRRSLISLTTKTALDLANAIEHSEYLTRNDIYSHPQALASIRNFTLNIYIDVLTLQERIAGRSPAFEGIRLVKERIR